MTPFFSILVAELELGALARHVQDWVIPESDFSLGRALLFVCSGIPEQTRFSDQSSRWDSGQFLSGAIPPQQNRYRQDSSCILHSQVGFHLPIPLKTRYYREVCVIHHGYQGACDRLHEVSTMSRPEHGSGYLDESLRPTFPVIHRRLQESLGDTGPSSMTRWLQNQLTSLTNALVLATPDGEGVNLPDAHCGTSRRSIGTIRISHVWNRARQWPCELAIYQFRDPSPQFFGQPGSISG
jgi:hypothetical protein